MIAAAQFAALCCLSLAYLTEAERLAQHHGSHHAPATASHQVPPIYYTQAESFYTPPRVTHSRPQQKHSQAEPSFSSTVDEQMPMPFGYGYGVNDQNRGIDFGHNTNSDGKLTTGEYRVLLPDGRTQIVTYTVDDYNGYQAEVTYERDVQSRKHSHTNEHNAIGYEESQASYGQPKPVSEQTQRSYGQPKRTYEETHQQPPTAHKFQETTYIESKSSNPHDTLYRSHF